MRSLAIRFLWRKPTFIHELQLEPWGPKNIWEMSLQEQKKSMSAEQVKMNLQYAKQCKQKTVDLWGAEWWYWLVKKQNHTDIWETILKNL